LFAVALVAYLIQPGDTLSGIAASHGVTIAAVEAANPQLSNPNLIYAGKTIEIPGGSPAAQRPDSPAVTGSGSQSAPAQRSVSAASVVTQSRSSASPSSASSGSSSSSLSDVPGVPQAFAACVAYRESTDLQNPAAEGNAYGIIPASGYNVNGTSLAYQKQVAVGGRRLPRNVVQALLTKPPDRPGRSSIHRCAALIARSTGPSPFPKREMIKPFLSLTP
jgi:LysM repeat protein